MKRLVLGTAGHIDHGKTTLVKALTGMDTDRLKEEKKRGITIELGFAWLDLPSGQRLSIVDVPGHEKFVRHMVAGAAGIDLVALVIAADEGVMPQTREHLDICKLLGVRQGLVVLTKADMVDEDWLALVQEDLAGFLAGTFLEDAPILTVSAVTGQGVPELLQALDKLAAAAQEAPASGPFRLPVDRVFSMKGFGTVVTGTAAGGVVELGQDVAIYPRGLVARVRGLQVHGQDTPSARRGQRTAINLQGVEKHQISRGDVISEPDTLAPSLWLDLYLEMLPEAVRPLKHRAPARLHTGTAEVLGRIHTLDRDQIEPGDKCYCQIRLEEPVALVARDRYVLRSYSPVDTIAGGLILHPNPGRHKRNRPEILEDLKVLHHGQAAERIAVLARLADHQGFTAPDLVRLTALGRKELDGVLSGMQSRRELVRYDKESGRMVGQGAIVALSARLAELLGAYHAQNPLKPGMPRGELRSRLARDLDPKLFAYLLQTMAEKGEIAAEQETARLASHRVRVAGEEEALQKKFLEAYQSAGLTPPYFKDLAQGQNPAQAKELLQVLVREGKLIKVKEDLYYPAEVLVDLKKRVVAHIDEHGQLDASQFKDMTGLSRKYLIPLLEYFDGIQLTMRVGDHRVLRKRDA